MKFVETEVNHVANKTFPQKTSRSIATLSFQKILTGNDGDYFTQTEITEIQGFLNLVFRMVIIA